MKWTDVQIDELKQLCHQGLGNRAIAAQLGCNLTDVYAKRSQLGITIAKCKGIEANLGFKKALAPTDPEGMCKSVRTAFKSLFDAMLLAMASDWTSEKDAKQYAALANTLAALEDSYNARIGRERR